MSEPLAGRVYVPRLYRTSGRGDLLRAVLDGVAASGGRVLYTSSLERPSILPVYLGVEAGEDRLGLLVYPFRCNPPPIARRPPDEHRVQVRYGSEASWGGEHPVARDIAGVDVTILVGVHPSVELLIGLDPFTHDPLKMGISVEFKDAHVRTAATKGWHVWERENITGRRRGGPRSPEGTEILIAFAPDRLLDYARFERQASTLGLDPPLRYRLAEAAASRRSARHALEEKFGLSAADILDVIGSRNRLGVAVRGGVAEHHLLRLLSSSPAIRNADLIDRDGEADVDVTLADGRALRIECKNTSPRRFADGTVRVEVQKTRSQRDDPAGRLYKPEQFDVVAACLFSVTGLWEFRFKLAGRLDRSQRHPDRIAPIQRVDHSWVETLWEAASV